MTFDERLFRSSDVCDLSRRLAGGECTAVENLESSLSVVERHNPHLNAIIAQNPDAYKEAIASDRRRQRNETLSPVDGIPVAIKDNLLVRDLPCTWGSRLFEDNVPRHDEIPIEKLRSLGVVVIGKTNVPEFTLEGYCANAIHGVTGNPWAPDLTPGGSSGGSAAAVASGMVPFALGTDGGGSIRRPAAYTGLVGLKPSIGRIARGGGLPQLLLDFEVVGLLNRSVRDSRLIYSLMAGYDSRDHLSDRFPENTNRFSVNQTNANRALDKAKILFVESFGGAPLASDIAVSVRRAAGRLADLGHDVQSGALPIDIDSINEFWPLIGQFSLASLLKDIPDFRVKAAPQYVALAEQGEKLSAVQVSRGLDIIQTLRNTASQLFEEYDFVLTPSCAAMPWPADEVYPTVIDGTPVGPRGHALYTGWVNACGHPAISLPCDPGESGLPVGFQLVAGFGREQALFSIAEQYEYAHPWRHCNLAPLPEISKG